MGAFVISKRFNGDFKFVFTSRKGKVIFTSKGYPLKENCEDTIALIKANVGIIDFAKSKAQNGKYSFRVAIADELLATSRKYTTELRVLKGIDEIVKSVALAEILDFSEDTFVFPDAEIFE